MPHLPLPSAVALMALVCLAAPNAAVAKPAGNTSSEAGKTSSDKEAPGEALTAEAINAATFSAPETPEGGGKKDGKKESKKARAKGKDKRPQPLLVKVQVLLDRAHFSPGAIDGRDGENMRNALSAFAVAQGLPASQTLNQELFDKLAASSADPVVATYTITDTDASGPFAEKIPAKMEEQADLEAMNYTNPREMLAERFHMSRDLLSALNPDAAFDKSGTGIVVAAVPPLETGKPAKDEAKSKSKSSGKSEDKARDASDGKSATSRLRTKARTRRRRTMRPRATIPPRKMTPQRRMTLRRRMTPRKGTSCGSRSTRSPGMSEASARTALCGPITPPPSAAPRSRPPQARPR